MALTASICFKGPTEPGCTGSMPSRGIFNIAFACNGMSGRDQASGAGDKSSVLVSPGTLNTVTVIFSATSGREVNHSPAAHDSITCLAAALPALAFSATSWNASNINKVFDKALAAASAVSALSNAAINGCTL